MSVFYRPRPIIKVYQIGSIDSFSREYEFRRSVPTPDAYFIRDFVNQYLLYLAD